MGIILRIATLVVLLVGLPGSGLGRTAEAPAVARHDIVVPDSSWGSLVEWAMGRYTEVGLELPGARISVYRDRGPCGDNSGLYRPGQVPEVRICVDAGATSTTARLILLHELGHLWAENRMDGEARDAFLAVRGLTSWSDSGLPRHQWGAEHAAEVLSWGLMDEEVRIIRIYDAAPDQMATAFEVLTGSSPLVLSG